MIEESVHKYLRHVIDFDGVLDAGVTSYAMGFAFQSEFFHEYDSVRNSFNQNSESMLFDIAREYYDEFRRPIPESVVVEELTSGNDLTALEKKGIIDSLNNIRAYPVNQNELPYIATTIRENYQRVRSYYAINKSLDGIHEDPNSAIKSLQLELQRIKQVADYKGNDPYSQSKTHTLMTELMFDEFYKHGGTMPPSIQFGFKNWDTVYGGLAPGELLAFSANAGVGKSFFLKEISFNVAFEQQKKVVIVDREMNDSQNFARLLARETRIPARKLRDYSKLSEAEKELVELVRQKHRDGGYDILWIPFTRANTVRSIQREIEAHFGRDKPALITVDYLDELEIPSRMSTWEGIQYNLAALKELGPENRCPVATATQNNASGMKAETIDQSVVAQRSVLKKADYVVVLTEDKTRPFAPPSVGAYDAIPGIVLAKFVKSRSEARTEFEMLVDYSRSIVEDYDGVAEVNRVLQPEKKSRGRRETWD